MLSRSARRLLSGRAGVIEGLEAGTLRQGYIEVVICVSLADALACLNWRRARRCERTPPASGLCRDVLSCFVWLNCPQGERPSYLAL